MDRRPERSAVRIVHATTDATGFVRTLLAQYNDVADLEVRRASLEDTYLAMVQRQESSTGAAPVEMDIGEAAPQEVSR